MKTGEGDGIAQIDYLKPIDAAVAAMARVREAAKAYSDVLETELPEGPDKTWILRNHRTTAMWANVAITRQHERQIGNFAYGVAVHWHAP